VINRILLRKDENNGVKVHCATFNETQKLGANAPLRIERLIRRLNVSISETTLTVSRSWYRGSCILTVISTDAGPLHNNKTFGSSPKILCRNKMFLYPARRWSNVNVTITQVGLNQVETS